MTKRIRILEIISGFAVEGLSGGIGRFGIELCRALGPDQFELMVCGLWDHGTPAEQERIRQLNAQGIEAFTAAVWNEHAPYRCFWRALRRLQAVLAQKPVSILHSHYEFSDVAALILKVTTRTPTVMRTVHNEYVWKKRPLRRALLTHWLYPLMFDVEIGVSQSIVDQLNKRQGARAFKRPALCLYNAIDLERFANVRVDVPAKRRSLQLNADALVVGSVGRLTEQKGYAVLLEAAALVLQHLPQAHFVIIGDGELADSLKELAQRLNIARQVIFTGSRPDVEELLISLDLFVSSSLWEGLPTVVQESMASGVPVVATDIPGTRELIQHGITGWLVPAGSPTELGQAIVEALKNPALRAEWAGCARQAVRAFSIGAVAARHSALYISRASGAIA